MTVVVLLSVVGTNVVGAVDAGTTSGAMIVLEGVAVAGTPDAQGSWVMVFVSRVVAPFWASSRPRIEACVVAVIEVPARIVPRKLELVPSVAELPTCQYTLQVVAPFSTTTELAEAVINVDEDRNTKTADGSPWVSRYRVPVMASVGEV